MFQKQGTGWVDSNRAWVDSNRAFYSVIRPPGRPVRTRDKLVHIKVRNEWMQILDESRQTGFPKNESTCSDPRRTSLKENGDGSMQRMDESNQPGSSWLGRLVNRPVRTRGCCVEWMSRLIEKKLPKMSFGMRNTFFAPFLNVMTIFIDEHEWKWPVEWIDLSNYQVTWNWVNRDI